MSSCKLQLSLLYHVPQISHNVLFVYQLTSNNICSILLETNGYSIKDLMTNRTLLQGPSLNGLYPLHLPCISKPLSLFSAPSSTTIPPELWHRRLRHPHQQLYPSRHYLKLDILDCTTYKMAKSHHLLFSISTSCSCLPLEIVHIDVRGSSPTPSNQDLKYYVFC